VTGLILGGSAARASGSTELFPGGAAPAEQSVSGTDAPTAAPEPVFSGVGAPPGEVVEAARASRLLPLAERMKAISEPLLDRPYLADPLGEGEGLDPDPPARYDVFDCLTFVEEVLALALSGDPVHAAQTRNALRYGDAAPTYATRRHFMELQWIPENVAAGWMVDATDRYGPTQTFTNQITASTWANWGRRTLFALDDDQLPVGEMRLEVLPLEQALEAVDQIAPGSIVLTVREHRPWVPLWVTHLGFTVPAERTTLRHASRMSSSRRVRDHSLEWYLEHLKTYENWKAAGISILEPREAGPRLSRLAAEGQGSTEPR